MKYWMIGLTIVGLSAWAAFAQVQKQQLYTWNGYDAAWRSVDSLTELQQPESALAIVEEIYAHAKAEKNSPQRVKATIYKSQFARILQEENELAGIQVIENELVVSEFPEIHILQSILADQYWSYYQSNRWKFSERTPLADGEKGDISTWDLVTLHNKTRELYTASVSERERLKKVAIKQYDVLLVKGDPYGSFLRPTLFDFLGQRAFSFLSNDEAYLTQPAYTFQIDHPMIFEDAKQFAGFHLDDGAREENKLLAVKLLQELTMAHLFDPYPDVLIDLNLQRYQFAKENAIMEDRDTLYLKALIRDEKQYSRDSSSARLTSTIAYWYYMQGNTYDRLEGKTNKWALKTALEYAEKGHRQFPESVGGKACASLERALRAIELETNASLVTTPKEYVKLFVEYRNIDTVFIQVFRSTPELLTDYKYMDEEERKKEIGKLDVERSFIQVLSGSEDLQSHVTELKIDPLPLGCYFVVASTTSDATKEGIWSSSGIWVSDLDFLSVSNQHNEDKEFYIVDRSTGHPIKGVLVETYVEDWDQFTRRYRTKNLSTYTSNADGLVTIKEPLLKSYQQFGLRLKNGADQMISEDRYFIARNTPEIQKPQIQSYLFTDRNIYRPGQTIYFKGLLVEESADGKSKDVVKQKKTNVKFYDVNYQLLAEQELTTNAYGSFAGTFTTPVSALNGQMHIQTEWGSAYFSVEEYKRPTFKTEIAPLAGDFAVNDTVRVKGNAKAYSGAVIDNAAIQYRVVRSARFPYYYWNPFIKFPYAEASTEISSGTATTDAEGNFTIPFIAVPDLAIDKSTLPEFYYEVYVDVTDVSGETRSANTSVRIGYHSLQLSAAPKASYSNTEKAYLRLQTSNLNGTVLDAAGILQIYTLDAPKKLLRPRNWARPDVYLYSEEEYRKYFPKDEYANELDPQSWQKRALVAQQNWNTALADSVALPLAGLPTGKYRIELKAKDKNGIEITAVYTIDVLAAGAYQATPAYILETPTSLMGKVGEISTISFGSSAPDVQALMSITDGNGNVRTNWFTLKSKADRGKDGAMMDIEVPINEDDRGGKKVDIGFIKDGQFHLISYQIYVPWDNKELQVTVETHRDKLQPGAQETWKVKISGKHTDAVAAEFLASMYDASLDALSAPHYWPDISWRYNYSYDRITGGVRGTTGSIRWINGYYDRYYYPDRAIIYDRMKDVLYGRYRMDGNTNYFDIIDGVKVELGSVAANYSMSFEGSRELESVQIMDGRFDKVKSGFVDFDERNSDTSSPQQQQSLPDQIPVRTNFNETAFFYPQLQTDSTGAIVFSFTMPEALTTWKFMGFAHTKDLQSGFITEQIITQKELMVQPNMPRFLRAGDRMVLAAKVSNLTEAEIRGEAQLELFNAMNMQSVQSAFQLTQPKVQFTATEKGSTMVQWEIVVPEGIDALVYRVKAGNATFTDGEENALPVLTNKILVTESLPLWTRGSAPKAFTFDRLLNSKNSSTLRHQSVTLEYSSNPAWYAVQALPYMMEYPYECAEQVFSRYYANAIAFHIATSDPEIKRVFDSWKTNPSSLTSNLEKNAELKGLLLEETPWVLQAQNESERKKRVALLFDINRMENERNDALKKLEQMQLDNGGWPWFKGSHDDRYITQYLVTGFAHLKQLNAIDEKEADRVQKMLDQAIPYCSARAEEDYTRMKRDTSMDKATYVPDNLILQYVYAMSYYPQFREQLSPTQKEAFDYYLKQIENNWTKYDLYQKGLIALILHRDNKTKTTEKIIKSLTENSMRSEEMGMYWKSNTAGYYWYTAPIETQALMIEVYNEVAQDDAAVQALQVWLLRQKQTTDWKTTRATAEACYALLSRGSNLLAAKELAQIMAGGTTVQADKTELGTGYFKTNWLGTNIRPELGNISITPPQQSALSYGAMYWQYFEDMDKVTRAETNIKLEKQLYLQVNTASGPQLKAISESTALHVGDLVKVRMVIKSDRDMEYVHLKDMRASGFEPVNVLSQYKWQDGLGYYESTGDASTNFFISYLPKGTYVFEYALRVAHKGYFSNGISTIQCMYAPEFTSHSEGMRVLVE